MAKPPALTAEPWHPGHPVLRLIERRRAAGSLPGRRESGDDARLGLAVEGGGMRGIVSAAMLSCLDDRGALPAFDVVYGSSSGAINSAYFLAGDTWYPLSIYYDDLTTPIFLNFRRMVTGGSPLNLDYAFNTVVDQVKPLRYDVVLASPTKLKISVTLVDELETLTIDGFHHRDDLKEALIASAWLPLGVKGTGTFRGRRVVDGGVLTALPFNLAARDGCTHVLSLSTRPMQRVTNGVSLAHRYTARHLDRMREGLGAGYLNAIEQRRSDQQWLHARRRAIGGDPPYVLDLAPLPGMPEVKRHELGAHRLIEAARNAYSVMYAAIEGESANAIRKRRIQAIPRLTIAQRDENGDVRFVDHISRPMSRSPRA